MKTQRRKLISLLLCAALLLAAFFSGRPAFALAAAVPLLLTLVSFLLNLMVRRRLNLTLNLPPTAAKGSNIEASVSVSNGSRLPCGPALVRLAVKNGLTGETARLTLSISASPLSSGKACFSLSSDRCGYVRVSLERLLLTDWFGFLPLPVKAEATAGTAVLPDTFEPQVTVEVSPLAPEEEEEYSPDKPGFDYSETFQIREYREGDSLKQIHWKLSEKLDKAISRDPSLPVARSLLVFWDKNSAPAGPIGLDAMAEAVSSICQELSRQGLVYTLGYADRSGCTLEEVSGTDALLQLIPEALKYGRDEKAETLTERFGDSFGFAKTLYFAGPVSEIPFETGGMVTALLCCEEGESVPGGLTYSPETLREDLHSLYL